MRHLILAFALAALLLLPAGVRADVNLSTDVARPANFVTEREVGVTQKLTLAGMPFDTKVDTTQRHQVTQGKQDAEGNNLFELSQQAMQAHMELPMGITVDVDTTADKAETNNPQAQFVVDAIKGTAGLKVTFSVSPDGRVQSAHAEAAGLDTLGPQSRAVLESQLSEVSLKRELQQELDMLPHRVVKPGEFWNTTVVLDAGQGQLLTFTRQCEYVGPVEVDGKTLHQIDYKGTDVKFEIEPSGGLPLKLDEANLSIAESKGTLYFDASRSRIVTSNGSTRVTGELKFSANDQEIPAALDLKITAKSHEVE